MFIKGQAIYAVCIKAHTATQFCHRQKKQQQAADEAIVVVKYL
jgi:hypothetical protein